MSTSNRDRRRAKQKARDQRRQAPVSGLTPFQQALELVHAASQPEVESDPALLARFVDVLVRAPGADRARLIDRALLHAPQEALGYLWAAGWQPADLVRVVRRECDDRAAAVMVDIIAARMREYPAATVDPRWAAQLLQLDATVWWASDDEWASGWATRQRLERSVLVETVIRVLRRIRTLPGLPVLVPPPGKGQAGEDPRTRGIVRPRAAAEASGGNERTLDRIRALLAKAESTTFPAEAEAFTAKAQELMARHSIDAALVDATGPGGPRRAEPIGVRIGVDAPYEVPKSVLLAVVADANRCRSVFTKAFAFCTVFGFPTDLDLVDLLYTSLLVQATAAMTAEGSRTDRHGRSTTRSFRQSFLTAYANRIGERLAGATRDASAQAAAEVGDAALLPVLAARDEAVQETFASVFPNVTYRKMSISNLAGWESGRAAADRASLHPREQLDG